MSIDLSLLPAPDVIEALDFETLLAARKARLIALYPEAERETIAAVLELESEPIVRLLQENTYRELVLRGRYNDEARALMLAYATGGDLDHIGVSYYQEARLLVSAADLDATPPVAAVYEGDTDYRARLASKVDSYSTAGPRLAYEWHAKSASALVKDARCDSPTPGTSRVAILSTIGDGTPNAELLSAVIAALSGETVRPLCEAVQVVPAEVKHYSVTATLTVLSGPDQSVVHDTALAALVAYTRDRHRLGHDITLSGLYAAAHCAGVQRATLNLTSDILCTDQQAAYCNSITVIIEGEDL